MKPQLKPDPWAHLNNRAMADMLGRGEAIDVSTCQRDDKGNFVVANFIDDVDYCDAATERWVWSIGRHKASGAIVAAFDTRFFKNADYQCLWLR